MAVVVPDFLRDTIVDEILLTVGLVAALAGALWRLARRIDHLVVLTRDIMGEPARAGVEARPGVMERMAGQDSSLAEIAERVARIETAVTPNGGKSAHDALMARLDQIVGQVDDMRRALTAHIVTSEADRLDIHRQLELIAFRGQ